MYADIHSHVLPYIDDGAKDLETAVQLVIACTEQGIDTIVCTPHFSYSKENTVEIFIKKREESLNLLKSELKKRDIPAPEFVLGAEVAFDCDLTEIKDLEKLAIAGTNYILLEMPDVTWQTWMFDYIYTLIAQKNLIPIIAHVERYNQTKEVMDKLKRLEVYFQVSASAVAHRKLNDNVCKLLKSGDVHFIATDTHSLRTRPPEMKRAMEVIKTKFSPSYEEALIENSYKVLKNVLCHKKEVEYYTFQKKKPNFFSKFFK